jgi:hypothetical protein
MKIINRTHWRTDHLRAFVSRVAKDELDPAKRKVMKVYVEYTRGSTGSSGCAPYNGNWLKVRLCSGAGGRQPDKVDLAGTLAHEMAHTRGMRHWQMQGNRYSRGDAYRARYAWAQDLPLERKPVRRKAPVDVQAQRHKRVLESLKRWQTKLKRAETALKKLRTQERYYERALEAKAAQGKAPAAD